MQVTEYAGASAGSGRSSGRSTVKSKSGLTRRGKKTPVMVWILAVSALVALSLAIVVFSLDQGQLVLRAGGVLAVTTWVVVCFRYPDVAIWGLLLWIPVQGWVQLNVFDNANWSVLLSDVQTGLLYLSVAVRALRNPRRWYAPAVLLFALPFVIWFCVLIPLSLSSTGLFLVLIAIRTYIFPLLMVYVGYRAFASRSEVAALGTVLMAQLAFIAVITVFQYTLSVDADGRVSYVPVGFGFAGALRPPGTFSSPGHLGMYLMTMIPLGIGLLGLSVDRRQRLWMMLGLGGAVVALAVNSQRSAILQLAVALPLMLLFARRITLRNVLTGVLLVAAVFAGGRVVMGDAFERRIGSISDNFRFALIEAPRDRLELALENPVLGQGLGTASPGTARLDIEALSSAESFMAALVSQVGVPGLLFYYLFLSSLLWQGIRAVARCKQSELKLLAAAIVSYEVAVWLQSWTYDPLHYPPGRYIFWFWAGALLSFPTLARRGAPVSNATVIEPASVVQI